MKLYIAGPMTGLPDHNYPAFHDAEARLRAAGYDVESPVKNSEQVGTSEPWSFYVRAGLRQMLDCDAVAVLPGWETSRGARLETHVATTLMMPVAPVRTWLVSCYRTGV